MKQARFKWDDMMGENVKNCCFTGPSLYREGFPTATCSTYIRVVEDKFWSKPGDKTNWMSWIQEAQSVIRERAILALLKVHLCAKDGELGFLVNEDGHSVLIHHFILGLFCLGIVESVTQTCPEKQQVSYDLTETIQLKNPEMFSSPLHPRVRTPILRPSVPGWAAVNVLILIKKKTYM